LSSRRPSPSPFHRVADLAGRMACFAPDTWPISLEYAVAQLAWIKAALEEDASLVGASFVEGEHMIYVTRLLDLAKKNCLEDVKFAVGEVIPPNDVIKLREILVYTRFIRRVPQDKSSLMISNHRILLKHEGYYKISQRKLAKLVVTID
jgi:hypothetical protein